jgi:hypothetical protein
LEDSGAFSRTVKIFFKTCKSRLENGLGEKSVDGVYRINGEDCSAYLWNSF